MENIEKLRGQLMEKIDQDNLMEVEKVNRYIEHIESYRRMEKSIKQEGESVTTINATQEFDRDNATHKKIFAIIKNNYVTEYIDSYRNGDIVLNKERIMLIDYIEEHVLTRDDIYFDETMIANFIRFAEKWYFPLQPFQKFLVA